MGQTKSKAHPKKLPGCLSSKCVSFSGFGSTRNLKLNDVPVPQMLGHNAVMIKVTAASISSRDLERINGNFSAYLTDEGWPKLVGYEGVGKVESIGKEVSTIGIREEVMFRVEPGMYAMFGSASEYVVVQESSVVRKPLRWNVSNAATLPLAGLDAISALKQLSVQNDDKLLIVGERDGVGLYALQIAQNHFHVQDIRVLVFSEQDEAAYKTRGAKTVVRIHTSTRDNDSQRDKIANTSLQIAEELASSAEQLVELREWSADAVLDCTGAAGALIRVVLNSVVGRPCIRRRRMVSLNNIPSGDSLAATGRHVSFLTQLYLYWHRDTDAYSAATEFGIDWVPFCSDPSGGDDLRILGKLASEQKVDPLPIVMEANMEASWGDVIESVVQNGGHGTASRWILLPQCNAAVDSVNPEQLNVELA